MRKYLLAAAAILLALPALAYPERPIALIVPYSAGGDSDLAGRNLAASAQTALKQTVVVINKAGASGALGSQFVRDAASDGYTLLVARVGSNAALPALKKDLAYKWDDFTFIGLLELNPVVCVVRADSPYRKLDDLKRALAANPGKFNFSSAGIGTLHHFGAELLLRAFGLPADAATHVPYKGGGEAALAVVSQQVDFSCGNLTSAIGLLQGHKLRALVVTMPERVQDIPDVPTAREAGYPQLEAIVGWTALYGPPKMDKTALAAWTSALAKIAKDPAWLAGEHKIGSIPRILAPQATATFVAEQFNTYAKLGAQLHLELK